MDKGKVTVRIEPAIGNIRGCSARSIMLGSVCRRLDDKQVIAAHAKTALVRYCRSRGGHLVLGGEYNVDVAVRYEVYLPLVLIVACSCRIGPKAKFHY